MPTSSSAPRAAGKAIFCEKPIDLDVDRVRACLEVVKKTGATLMVGFNRRFDPNFAALRRRVAEGAIGALEIVSITSRDPGPPPISYIARSGGLFRDMMIHDFDMARFLLGEEPVAVSAMGSALVDKAIGEAGDIDTAVVIMETASGKVAQISNSRRATYGYDQRVEAHGAKGMLRADNVRETTVELAGAHGFASDKALNFFLERYDAAYRNELDAFIGAAKSGGKPHPDGEDGLKALLLADAAYRSWKTKQRVSVGLTDLALCRLRPQRHGPIGGGVNRKKAWRRPRNDARLRTGRRSKRRPRSRRRSSGAWSTPSRAVARRYDGSASRRASSSSLFAATIFMRTLIRDRSEQGQGRDRRDGRRSDRPLLRLHGAELPRAYRL